MLSKEISENPLISIVLPVYNIRKYLDKCFESLIKQTYQNIEIVFVDDGATDGSGEILDSYVDKDPRVVVYHKINGGLSDARNYGTLKAKGEYITYVDPDDYIDADYVEYLFELVRKFKTKMSICQHRVLYQSGKVKECAVQLADVKMTSEEWLKGFLYNDINDTSAYCKLIHRDLLDGIAFPKGKIFEDLATMYRFIIRAENVAVGYQSKYNYIFHVNSISNSKFNEKYFDYSKITDDVVDEIVKRFPNLLEPSTAKRCRARFSVLNLMINTDSDYDYPEKRMELVRYIKKYRRFILTNSRVSKVEKIAAILISINYLLYRTVWRMHRKNIMG